MQLRTEIDHFHQEHQGILDLLRDWEQALALAASEDKAERCRGLEQLRKMEPCIVEISQHCREEEQSADSVFRLYLDDASLQQLQAEHFLLEGFHQAYLEELRYVTTPPPSERLVNLGRKLVAQLRQHIGYEENLLKQIAQNAEAEENVFLRYTQPAE